MRIKYQLRKTIGEAELFITAQADDNTRLKSVDVYIAPLTTQNRDVRILYLVRSWTKKDSIRTALDSILLVGIEQLKSIMNIKSIDEFQEV